MASPNHRGGSQAGPSNSGPQPSVRKVRWPLGSDVRILLSEVIDPIESTREEREYLESIIPDEHRTTSCVEATHILHDRTIPLSAREIRIFTHTIGRPLLSFEWAYESVRRNRSQPEEQFAIVGTEVVQPQDGGAAEEVEEGVVDAAVENEIAMEEEEEEKVFPQDLPSEARPVDAGISDAPEDLDLPAQPPQSPNLPRKPEDESEEDRRRREKGKGREEPRVEAEAGPSAGGSIAGGQVVGAQSGVAPEIEAAEDDDDRLLSRQPSSPPQPEPQGPSPAHRAGLRPRIDKGKGRAPRGETPLLEDGDEEEQDELDEDVPYEDEEEDDYEDDVPSNRLRLVRNPSRSRARASVRSNNSPRPAEVKAVSFAAYDAVQARLRKLAVLPEGEDPEPFVDEEPVGDDRLWCGVNCSELARSLSLDDGVLDIAGAPAYANSAKSGGSYTREEVRLLIHTTARKSEDPKKEVEQREISYRMCAVAFPDRSNSGYSKEREHLEKRGRVKKEGRIVKEGFLQRAVAFERSLGHPLPPLPNPFHPPKEPYTAEENRRLAALFVQLGDGKDGFQGFDRKAHWLLNHTRRRTAFKTVWDPVWQAFYPEKNPKGTARKGKGKRKGRERASSDSDSSHLTELSTSVSSRASSSRSSAGPSKRRRTGSGESAVEDEDEDEDEGGRMEE